MTGQGEIYFFIMIGFIQDILPKSPALCAYHVSSYDGNSLLISLTKEKGA